MKIVVLIFIILFSILVWQIYHIPAFQIPEVEFSEILDAESGFTFKRPRQCRRDSKSNLSSYIFDCNRRAGPIFVNFVKTANHSFHGMRRFALPNGHTAFYMIVRRDNPGSGGDEYTLTAYLPLGDTSAQMTSVEFGEFGRPSFGLAWAVLNSVGR